MSIVWLGLTMRIVWCLVRIDHEDRLVRIDHEDVKNRTLDVIRGVGSV